MRSPATSEISCACWRRPTNQGLVADEPEGEADQDWCEGREPRSPCRLPDGRGRDSTANVPGDIAAHCGTAAAAATSARDEKLQLTLPGGRVANASLAGRDPTTDVAVLRFQPDGLPVATTAEAQLRAGQVVVAVGSYEGAPLAALGIVALAGGAWHSRRGGTIDSLIRLDIALQPAGEGGALVDVQGQVTGMIVLGPRRRALAIPTSTINRTVDKLLAKGQVFLGSLGAGFRSGRLVRSAKDARAPYGRGVLVVSIDPDGPAARAGLLVGDIVVNWNAEQIERVREVIRLLGPDSAGNT